MPREISASHLAERLRAGPPVLLLDVREDWEREICRLPGDVHLPMDQIPARAGALEVPPGAQVVTYCHAGVRSWMAARYLEHVGFLDVLSLAGGIDAWSTDVDPGVARY